MLFIRKWGCFLISTFTFACNLKSQNDLIQKTVSIGTVTLKIPVTYKFVKGRGIDSYVAYILNEKNDTLQIEYGRRKTIYDLFDYPPVAFPIEIKDKPERDSNMISSTEVVYTKYPEEDNKEGVFLKEYYRYDTVGPLVIKMVQPKRIEEGKTGMFISDLPDSNCLSIYALNLDSTEHMEALKLFHTIKLKH